MSAGVWKFLRELLHGDDFARARGAEAAAHRLALQRSNDPILARELLRLAAQPNLAVRLGSFAESPRKGEDFLVDARDFLAHQFVLGASGSGKTFLLLNVLLTLLARNALGAAVVLDMKGELHELLTDLALPALASALPAHEADALLARVVVIDPFSPSFLPPLNVLVRDPSLPIEIQARDVAECFEAATDTTVSTRMETILDWTVRLVIEVGGTFLTVHRALQEPQVLDGLVRLSNDRAVVRYFLTRYPTEPKASRLALLARLDRFLALPMARLCLGANDCLDFDTLLRDRIVVVGLGKAPAGLQSVARFFAMMTATRFARAIHRRPPRGQLDHAVLLCDEWQVALTPALSQEFGELLALSRSRNVHLWLANQQLAQLDGHAAVLRSIVLGQTALQAGFRLAPEDTRLLRQLFPHTGVMPRQGAHGPQASPFLTASEELEARANAASRLPNRLFYWSDRRKHWPPLLLRSATLDLPPPGSLSPSYVARAQRGSVAFSVTDLTQMLDAEERRLDQLAAGSVHAPPPAAPSNAPAPVSVPPAKASAPKPKRPRRRPPTIR